MLNKYINDKLKVKPTICYIKKKYPKTTSKPSPSQDLILISSVVPIPPTTPPICSHVLTPRISLLLICHSFQ